VLDSLRVWREEIVEGVDGDAEKLANAIAEARDAGLLRAEHFPHLRCEIPMPSVVAEARELIGRADVRLASLMDHTPGQRQFRDPEKLRDYYRGKNGGMSDADLDRLFARRLELQKQCGAENHKALVDLARAHRTRLASHDDATADHVAEAVETASPSPSSRPPSRRRKRCMPPASRVLMGAPNLVRGGSDSGNVASRDLAAAGLLNIMSSDYVPSSLLMAALVRPDVVAGIDLAAAVRPSPRRRSGSTTAARSPSAAVPT
jgi:alpha-D-ribose 1-methylphosphonate 5-triphosphate diphosphatase